MAKKKLYQEQFCSKHNQRYAGYLKQCPICGGEKLWKKIKPEVEKSNKKLAKI